MSTHVPSRALLLPRVPQAWGACLMLGGGGWKVTESRRAGPPDPHTPAARPPRPALLPTPVPGAWGQLAWLKATWGTGDASLFLAGDTWSGGFRHTCRSVPCWISVGQAWSWTSPRDSLRVAGGSHVIACQRAFGGEPAVPAFLALFLSHFWCLPEPGGQGAAAWDQRSRVGGGAGGAEAFQVEAAVGQHSRSLSGLGRVPGSRTLGGGWEASLNPVL